MTEIQYEELKNALGWIIRYYLRKQLSGITILEEQKRADAAHDRILKDVESIFRTGYQEE